MHMVTARLGFEKAMVGTRLHFREGKSCARCSCVQNTGMEGLDRVSLPIINGCGQSHETAY